MSSFVSNSVTEFLNTLTKSKVPVAIPTVLIHPSGNFASMTWWGKKGYLRMDIWEKETRFESGFFPSDVFLGKSSPTIVRNDTKNDFGSKSEFENFIFNRLGEIGSHS